MCQRYQKKEARESSNGSLLVSTMFVAVFFRLYLLGCWLEHCSPPTSSATCPPLLPTAFLPLLQYITCSVEHIQAHIRKNIAHDRTQTAYMVTSKKTNKKRTEPLWPVSFFTPFSIFKAQLKACVCTCPLRLSETVYVSLSLYLSSQLLILDVLSIFPSHPHIHTHALFPLLLLSAYLRGISLLALVVPGCMPIRLSASLKTRRREKDKG